MTGLTPMRAAFDCSSPSLLALTAQQTSEKVNQQGGATSTAMAKSKVKKMSNAEIMRDGQSMPRVQSLMSHAPKAANTAPGII